MPAFIPSQYDPPASDTTRGPVVRLVWGNVEIDVTSMSYSSSAGGETDTTCIGKVTVGPELTDVATGITSQAFNGEMTDDNKTWAFWPEDETDQMRVIRSVDYGLVDPGKLQCEFFDVGQFNHYHVGTKRILTVVDNKIGSDGRVLFSGQVPTIMAPNVALYYRTATAPFDLQKAEAPSRSAYLTELGDSFVVGEFVKCNCTFTFTGQ